MAEILTRPKSPTRAEAIAIALKPGPVYSNKVLLGNWVEDRIECPKGDTIYFPPKENIDYQKMRPEMRHQDFKQNKLYSLQGNLSTVIQHDNFMARENYVTTNDLVYNHLPKPLCGPPLRHFRKGSNTFYPQPDLLKCFGNITEWGLRKHLQRDWNCGSASDFFFSLYDDTYTAPRQGDYLHACERKARDSSFTKTFRFKMTKPIARKN